MMDNKYETSSESEEEQRIVEDIHTENKQLRKLLKKRIIMEKNQENTISKFLEANEELKKQNKSILKMLEDVRMEIKDKRESDKKKD